VLIGLSGSGKSTVGRLLSSRLGLPVRDTDRLIEARVGATVASIFANQGEAEFRRLETQILADACLGCNIVATGGGVVLLPENRRVMREGNLVIWLDVPIPVLARRLAAHVHGEERPLLKGAGLQERLQKLYAERSALYKQTAHVRCAAPDSGPSGSHRIAVELTKIYRAWEISE
jgi:shikimate kinase